MASGLHPDRLFPADDRTRGIARVLYSGIKDLPVISPHGHTEPVWYARNEAFSDPATLFVKPDHYVFRMLYSQGVSLESLGVPRADGGATESDNRAIWRLFAKHFHLFRGTPTRLWFEQAMEDVFGIAERLTEANADRLYEAIAEKLTQAEFRPRALYERFRIEAISTTDGALDNLEHHDAVLASGWKGRVVPAYRPDAVIDPEFEGFRQNLVKLGEITGEDTLDWTGYLAAHRKRRAYFKARGCTSTDHGHASARTENLSAQDAGKLFATVISGKASPAECDAFRGQMLTEMARMSLADGLVMQIHPGSFRNHNSQLFTRFGRDKGADIPTQTDYVRALKPMLDAVGNEKDLTIIVFTLDETSYSRELAPLAGHYPALRLGPAWWFFDAPEGMRRFRELTTETAGFYNTVGFNDDTRAFLSIPARHDMARRVDCAFLARLVAEHRMDENEAHEVAHDLAYRLAKQAYKL
ncbi:MAG: glucuronate isomerase [Beijerinckiaceae bacterium]